MLGVVALLAAMALPAAEGGADPDLDDELPGRVGRVADVAGELFLSPPDRAADWAPIGQNYPVTGGDNLWVAGDGRAEVDYGGGQFRIAADTNLHVSRLDDRQLALFLAQGRLIVRLRTLEQGEIATVDTPNTQIQLTRPGLYRIEVGGDRGTTLLAVREGEALAAISGGAQQILPGQTAFLNGPEPAYADVRSGLGLDGFDSWSADRDRRFDRRRTSNYVSRQMVGWSDLDEHGSWDTHATYGAVWYPTAVATGWAPYRHGRWAHVGRWGWTWVDDAPWGYAPFHYGRWVSIGGRWGWCPGSYVARPVWAPALVGWYGGAGWSVAVGSGAPVYGWVPLGWGDAYVPWWGRGGCGERCWTHYNRPYAGRHAVYRPERPHAAPAVYANSRVPGAVTAVAGATMAGHRPVAANQVALPVGVMMQAPVMRGAPPVKPQRPPESRPVANAPAPASTFHSNPRPRLAITPPEGAAPASVRGPAHPGYERAPAKAGGLPPASAAAAPQARPESRPAPGRVPPPAPATLAPGDIRVAPSPSPAAAPAVRSESRPAPGRVPPAAPVHRAPGDPTAAPPAPAAAAPAGRVESRPATGRGPQPVAAPRVPTEQQAAPSSTTRSALQPVAPIQRGPLATPPARPPQAAPVAQPVPPPAAAPPAHGARAPKDSVGSAPVPAAPAVRQGNEARGGGQREKASVDITAPSPPAR